MSDKKPNEPWQKLITTLCEVWVEEDLKNAAIQNEVESREIKKDLIALREKWRKLPDYGCYWSSPDNPRGLQLTPTITPGKVSVDMVIDREHSGFPGIAHGGIAFTIIDGLMGWYLMSHKSHAGFTTNSVVEYHHPLKVGKNYTFSVTLDVAAMVEKGKIVLVGAAYNKEDDPIKPYVTIRSEFYLPRRVVAQKILGLELNDEFKEFFPE